MIPFPRITKHPTRSGKRYYFRDDKGRPVSQSVARWLTSDPWAFLDKDEDCVPNIENGKHYFDHNGVLKFKELEGSFICCGCGKRRPNSCGGADESIISVCCDHCVVRTWDNLALTIKAIAIQQEVSIAHKRFSSL